MRGSSALDRVALFLEERLENHLLMSFCRAIRLSCGVGESSLPPPSPHLTSSPSSQRSRVCLGLRNVPPPFPEAPGGPRVLRSITLHTSGRSDTLLLIHRKGLMDIFCLRSLSLVVSGARGGSCGLGERPGRAHAASEAQAEDPTSRTKVSPELTSRLFKCLRF